MTGIKSNKKLRKGLDSVKITNKKVVEKAKDLSE
jgi:hypothetical protein